MSFRPFLAVRKANLFFVVHNIHQYMSLRRGILLTGIVTSKEENVKLIFTNYMGVHCGEADG